MISKFRWHDGTTCTRKHTDTNTENISQKLLKRTLHKEIYSHPSHTNTTTTMRRHKLHKHITTTTAVLILIYTVSSCICAASFTPSSSSSSYSSCKIRKSFITAVHARRRGGYPDYDGEYERDIPTETSTQYQPMPWKEKPRPTLVIGVDEDGNGSSKHNVGALIVKQLLAKGIPTRAIVKDYDTAVRILGEDEVKRRDSMLEIVVGDPVNDEEFLGRVIRGCGAVVSACETKRKTKLFDLLPWRLFSTRKDSVEQWCWNDLTHPYFVHYKMQQKIVRFAEEHLVKKIVRVSDRHVGFSSLNIVTILYNLVYSMCVKYQCLGEDVIRNSTVSSMILRPGRLVDEERNATNVFVQVDSSGILDRSARISSTDLAGLVVASVQTQQNDKSRNDKTTEERSYTIGTRWVDQNSSNDKLRYKRSKSKDSRNAEDCILGLKHDMFAPIFEEKRRKEMNLSTLRPYASGVGMVVYTPLLLLFKFLLVLSKHQLLEWLIFPMNILRVGLKYSLL